MPLHLDCAMRLLTLALLLALVGCQPDSFLLIPPQPCVDVPCEAAR